MRRIYQKAKDVVVWLGPDTPNHLAKAATDSIRTMSDFLCEKLDLSITDLSTRKNLYQEVLYQNRHELPSPNNCDFSSDALWQSLIWFYSHAYFTRLWVIQEVNANTNRIVHCGYEQIEWDRVDLVAGYIIMNTTFSQDFGFSKTHCWWTATVTTERMRNPKNWLWMLYLASNFSCTDDRDMIYGLRGLMKLPDESPQASLLDPDYSKSTVEVYRDSVEAALLDYRNTDVLLYLTGNEQPSWIPRWNRQMLFRNPFRFGKALPWTPAGDTKVKWRIDKTSNALYLSGCLVDTIKASTSYNERYFSNNLLHSDRGIEELRAYWPAILNTLTQAQNPAALPLSEETVTAAANALSFGLDADAKPALETILLHNFLAYLHLVLPEDTFNTYIPSSLASLVAAADPHAFAKPVWDFPYPDSGLFVTSIGLVGCSVCVPMEGDVVVAPLGCTYPFILRPSSDGAEKIRFEIKGYAYVSGIMKGEMASGDVRQYEIR